MPQSSGHKVPTLRNVAVSTLYMHNGVFGDLRTVVLFYDKFNNAQRILNPETSKPWDVQEVDSNLILEFYNNVCNEVVSTRAGVECCGYVGGLFKS
jgi:cytochrome c peroxidase